MIVLVHTFKTVEGPLIDCIVDICPCDSPDVLKDCSLVGFNLGNTCQRLANVCVLHRKCSVFDDTCGQVLSQQCSIQQVPENMKPCVFLIWFCCWEGIFALLKLNT